MTKTNGSSSARINRVTVEDTSSPRAWVASQLRFERLLRSCERQAGQSSLEGPRS